MISKKKNEKTSNKIVFVTATATVFVKANVRRKKTDCIEKITVLWWCGKNGWILVNDAIRAAHATRAADNTSTGVSNSGRMRVSKELREKSGFLQMCIF